MSAPNISALLVAFMAGLYVGWFLTMIEALA